MIDLKTFYVTFGLGTFFGYHFQEIHAHNEEIVRRYMNKHYPNIWSSVREDEPVMLTSLGPPVELLYEFAEHV